MRTFTRIDRVIDQLDQTLKSMLVPPPADPYPETVPREQGELSSEERTLGGRLMRVNHAGEIAAQALYQGHALCARDAHVRDTLRAAGREELQHLHWTAARIKELKTHKSYLTPIWYPGSLGLSWCGGRIPTTSISPRVRTISPCTEVPRNREAPSITLDFRSQARAMWMSGTSDCRPPGCESQPPPVLIATGLAVFIATTRKVSSSS